MVFEYKSATNMFSKKNLIPKSFLINLTKQEIKFSIMDFFNKSDQIHSFLRIWSHLLLKTLMENFTFFVMPLY